MYFLNLVWLEDPAGGGDRQSPVHAALTPCTFTELPENRTLVFAQQPGQLTYKPLPFWFSLTISYHFFFISLIRNQICPLCWQEWGP